MNTLFLLQAFLEQKLCAPANLILASRFGHKRITKRTTELLILKTILI